jgi:hypothetical protein
MNKKHRKAVQQRRQKQFYHSKHATHRVKNSQRKKPYPWKKYELSLRIHKAGLLFFNDNPMKYAHLVPLGLYFDCEEAGLDFF